MLFRFVSAILLTNYVIGGPVNLGSGFSSAIFTRTVDNIFSFIALGESYASGVGAGKPDTSVIFSRCLRFDKAYPRIFTRDSAVPGHPDEARLINNACSGQDIGKILQTQPRDADSGDSDDFKAFGQPQFAIISAGGDGIRFKELVLSCIYEFPSKPKQCQDQIDASRSLIDSPEFFFSRQKLIKTTLDKGLVNHNDFRIYYRGYAQFFNTAETSPEFCSQKTWNLCKFWQRGCEKLPLDLSLPNKLNTLAIDLNFQIQAAIDSFKDTAQDPNGSPLVKFIDIDFVVQGHLYCEQGKEESVNNDNDICLFQWLDDETLDDDAKHEFYNEVAQRFSNVPDIETLQDRQLDGSLVVSAEDFFEAEVSVTRTNTTLATDADIENSLINRVKNFHPKNQFHELIEARLRDIINADLAPKQARNLAAGSCDNFQRIEIMILNLRSAKQTPTLAKCFVSVRICLSDCENSFSSVARYQVSYRGKGSFMGRCDKIGCSTMSSLAGSLLDCACLRFVTGGKCPCFVQQC